METQIKDQTQVLVNQGFTDVQFDGESYLFTDPWDDYNYETSEVGETKSETIKYALLLCPFCGDYVNEDYMMCPSCKEHV